jgi:hypothetical protein
VQNAEENVLREMGKWDLPTAPAPVDITKEHSPSGTMQPNNGMGQ